MSASLKLVSVNIERSKHLDRVEDFFRRTLPEVVCVQELMERDIPRLSRALGGAECYYEPTANRPDEPPAPVYGEGIFSRIPILKKDALYYAGHAGILPNVIQDDPSTYNNSNRAVLSLDVEKDFTSFRVLTTHFTWSGRGKGTEEQFRDMDKLLKILASSDEFLLCGDFNAPRGEELFAMLSSRYKDNVPPEYKTSIDISLHRAGESHPEELKDKMVDGIFSTPAYTVSHVEMVSGVSDHCALVATVSKTG